jgi:hypothetical protein
MLEELWSDAKVTKHDPAAAIKPKVVRPSNRKYAPAADDTLEDIERSLPLHERAPVREEFTGRPFAKRNAEKKALRIDERRSADKSPTDKKPTDKKYAGKKLSDKKFVDKKIQERKAAGKKSQTGKTVETKTVTKGRKPGTDKKTSTKKK